MSRHITKIDKHASHYQLRARKDFAFSMLVVTGLIIASFSFEVEFVESLYDFTRSHEDWELDEFIFSFFWVALVASVYAVRRVVDIIRLNESNAYNANHDSLTGLANRDFSQYLLDKMLHRAQRHNHAVAVIFLDLNNFKDINDSYGHDHGDLLLQQIAQRLVATIRNEEVVSRLGGDEFLIAAEFGRNKGDIDLLVERIESCVKKPFDLYGKAISTTFSIGLAIFPEHGESVSSLLIAADTAMYEAKRNSIITALRYTDEIGERNKEYLKLASNLKYALLKKELYLVYQPIVDNETGEVAGHEALTRWELENKQVNPEQIVSVAEGIGLSEVFFCWLIEEALQQSSSFQRPEQFISINVTAKQFLSENLLAYVQQAVAKYPHKNIELEVTESSIMVDYNEAMMRIRQLRALGIKVMIDDFGTGYSSLGRLKNLEIDKIKIDKSFLVDTESNEKSAKIFESIFGLATTLEIQVVAEGLESVEQLRFLRGFSSMLVQGYLVQKPAVKEQLLSDTEIQAIIKRD